MNVEFGVQDGIYEFTLSAGSDVVTGSIEKTPGSISCWGGQCFRDCTPLLCGYINRFGGIIMEVIVGSDGSSGDVGPETFSLAIDYQGERLGEQTFTPTYADEFPNGDGCWPCRVANEQMTLTAPTSTLTSF